MRTKSEIGKAEIASLLSLSLGELDRPSRRRPYCNHRRRPVHIENQCWTKLLHLNPRNSKDLGDKLAFVLNQSQEDPTICFMAKHKLVKGKELFVFLMAKYDKPTNPSFLRSVSSILEAAPHDLQ